VSEGDEELADPHHGRISQRQRAERGGSVREREEGDVDSSARATDDLRRIGRVEPVRSQRNLEPPAALAHVRRGEDEAALADANHKAGALSGRVADAARPDQHERRQRRLMQVRDEGAIEQRRGIRRAAAHSRRKAWTQPPRDGRRDACGEGGKRGEHTRSHVYSPPEQESWRR